MKLRKYLYLTLIICSSCTSWLDVTPKDIVVEEELFSTYTGYQNALNGVYKQISATDMYGQELSWGFLDVLGQCYVSGSRNTIGRLHVYYNVANFSYTESGVKGIVEGIWMKGYNSIANCNNIIGQIAGEDPLLFPEGEYEKKMIQGEALALRAFLHFDLLRLFAPSPVADDHRAYIPYFEKFPSRGENNSTVAEVLEKVIRDLKQAKELVQQFDTLDESHRARLGYMDRFFIEGKDTDPKDVFHAYRGYRMSYPAIAALLARVYNYAGQYDLARECAEEVINIVDDGSQPIAFFADYSEVKRADRKMSSDLIFSLSSPKLYENYLPYANAKAGSADACLVLNGVNNMFDDAGDYRGDKALLTAINSNKASNRNMRATTDNTGKMIEDMLPVIRLSEMYYIIAEYYASVRDWGNAALALDDVREGRNCTRGGLAAKITDLPSFRTELLKEVRREFITEGQIFFYYKKLNMKVTEKMSLDAFVLPLPESESIN